MLSLTTHSGLGPKTTQTVIGGDWMDAPLEPWEDQRWH